jgi:RNA polymerase sigma-54 factor
MKQTLQLRLGQHLTMTPQLQQAIRLLQLSALDLREEIQEALDSNPMLDVDDGVGEEATGPANGADFEAGGAQPAAEPGEGAQQAALDGASEVADPRDAGAEDMPVEGVGDDLYDTALSTRGAGSDLEGREFENQDTSAETLRDHLIWQMQMAHFSPRDRAIALAIIDAVNERGYLAAPLEDIHEGLTKDLEDLELDEVQAVLRRVQHFDPVGVGARDLRECLLIQLQFLSEDTPWLPQARELVAEHLDLFARREYAQITRRLKCSQQELQQIVTLVQSLNPHPGNVIADGRAEYVVPDVIVTREKNAWRVELNPEAVPRVRINPAYAGLVKRADSSSDNAYMRNQLQEARWFIKSLQSRNETLLKVATCIVERQRGFLEHGEEAMKALVLHDVAESVGMHESTISRVTTQKYMHTPRGIFELKYFFSSHVSTDGGGECSATAIRALIKKLVAAEDHSKPLSDSKIAHVLKQQGINVARRTIAKYREALSIPSSSERKRLV